jgi:hypothetical protein
MIKAKKIWIATHPSEPDNYKVKFTEPRGEGDYLYANQAEHEDTWVEFKEYALIELV